MKLIKITSLGCPSCIIMNNILNDIDIEKVDLDYDFDDIEKYNVGKILPVLIFIEKDKEITRLVGEHTKVEILNVIGDNYEKNI